MMSEMNPMVEVIVLVVDQETFDAALDEFLGEVTEILALIPLKAPGVDFGAELQQIQGAKVKLDAALGAAQVADPAPAPVEVPPVDETIPALGPDGEPVPVNEGGAWTTTPAPDAASATVEAPAPDAAPVVEGSSLEAPAPGDAAAPVEADPVAPADPSFG